MTTVTVLTGEQVSDIYTPVNAFDWADLGSSPYGSWSNWTSWRIPANTNVVVQLDDDLGSSDYRIPFLEVIQQGDISISLKISDTGTFTGEETTVNFVFETPASFSKGRYYRWTLTATANSEFATPIIQFFRTFYDTTLSVETLEDVDVFANSTTSLNTNLGLIRNIQATALQGDPYVVDGYVIASQDSSYTRTPASLTNSGSSIVAGRIENAFEFGGGADAITVALAQELPQGTTDFTFETWVYVDNSFVGNDETGYVIFSPLDSAASGDFFFFIEDNTTYASVAYQIEFDGSNVFPNQSPVDLQISTDTWHHWAVVRNGSIIQMYLDGVLLDTKTLPGGVNAVCNATVDNIIIGGNNFNQGFIGKIDELRITTTAKYNSAFTPQTWPFTNDPGTVLLLHAEDYTDDGGTVYGSDPYFIIQKGGSPVIKQKNPPQVQVVDYNGDAWDGTVDVVLRGYPKIQFTNGGVFPLAV
jgi:hypothetical protein